MSCDTRYAHMTVYTISLIECCASNLQYNKLSEYCKAKPNMDGACTPGQQCLVCLPHKMLS